MIPILQDKCGKPSFSAWGARGDKPETELFVRMPGMSSTFGLNKPEPRMYVRDFPIADRDFDFVSRG